MTVVFGEEKKISLYETSAPKPGVFALDKTPFEWITCRDRFANVFIESVEGFYFSYGEATDSPENIANFLRKTEIILSVSSKIGPFSEFSLTNRPYAMWIKPSKFWRVCPLRRSLLTILLRCGRTYKSLDDNYEESLAAESYAKNTSLAIKRFLFGFTEFNTKGYAGNAIVGSNGWQAIFNGVSLDYIRNILTTPVDTLLEKTLIGQGSIWN